MERYMNKATGIILEPADKATAEMLARSDAYRPCPAPAPAAPAGKRKPKAKEE